MISFNKMWLYNLGKSPKIFDGNDSIKSALKDGWFFHSDYLKEIDAKNNAAKQSIKKVEKLKLKKKVKEAK